jgi:hypothetical protein
METKEFQRWTAKRKVELLLQLIRGERKLVDVSPTSPLSGAAASSASRLGPCSLHCNVGRSLRPRMDGW